jgi:hypothetical protein
MADDDEKTKPVRAVQRRAAPTPIADLPTGPMRAVKRRSPAPASGPGLLPKEARQETCFHFVERSTVLRASTTSDRYEVFLRDGRQVLHVPATNQLLKGRRLEFHDEHQRVRFTVVHSLRKLVLNDLAIFDDADAPLGRITQHLTAREVKFDVLDARDALRFTLFQAADEHTRYEVRDGDFVVATLARERPDTRARGRWAWLTVDAFRVELHSSTLDETDRILLLSAGLFMDRLFSDQEDSLLPSALGVVTDLLF